MKAIRRILMGLGTITLLFIVIGLFGFYKLTQGSKPEPLNEDIYVTITLDHALSEQRQFSFEKGGYSLNLTDYTSSLRLMAEDDRVKGLYLRLKTPLSSITHLQEFTNALNYFKSTGKTTQIYAESFPNLATMVFASHFDTIWLQPTGTGSFAGIRLEVPYFQELLAKIGIEPEFSRKGAYKSAPESFTNTTPSRETIDVLGGLSQELYDQLLTTFKKNKPEVTISNDIYVTDTKLVEIGFVDKLDYLDAFIDEIDKTQVKSVPLIHYQSIRAFEREEIILNAPKIAYLNLNGAIIDPTMSAKVSALNKENVINPYLIQDSLRVIEKNAQIDHVLIRLNSPGGSPTGSEVIRHGIKKLQEAGKKVYISMSEVAASGGYWLATDADYIFANPATLTGSIGVYGGKFTLKNLWEKLGINWHSFEAGPVNRMTSHAQNLSEEDKQALEAMMVDIYEKFLNRVSQGRNIDKETLRNQIAGGRVWSGQKALEVGLVDELGGLQQVALKIKQDLEIEANQPLQLIAYPKEKTPLEEALSLLDNLFARASFWNYNITKAQNLFLTEEASTLDPLLIQ